MEFTMKYGMLPSNFFLLLSTCTFVEPSRLRLTACGILFSSVKYCAAVCVHLTRMGHHARETFRWVA